MKRCALSMITAVLAAIPLQSYAAPTWPSDGFFFKPYVGADYQYTKYGDVTDSGTGIATSDIAELNIHGGNLHMGARLHRNLGMEIGYFNTLQGEKSSDILGPTLNTSLQDDGITLDALLYLPVSQSFELIGTAGVAHAHDTYSIEGAGDTVSEEWQPRAGGGAQLWLTDNLNARALVRYQHADYDNSVHNAIVTTAGLNWQF